MFRISRLHEARSCVSSPDNPFHVRSYLTFIRPPPLWSSLPSLPDAYIGPSPLFIHTCFYSSHQPLRPYNIDLLSCTFFDVFPTLIMHLYHSFLSYSVHFCGSTSRPNIPALRAPAIRRESFFVCSRCERS